MAGLGKNVVKSLLYDIFETSFLKNQNLYIRQSLT